MSNLPFSISPDTDPKKLLRGYASNGELGFKEESVMFICYMCKDITHSEEVLAGFCRWSEEYMAKLNQTTSETRILVLLKSLVLSGGKLTRHDAIQALMMMFRGNTHEMLLEHRSYWVKIAAGIVPISMYEMLTNSLGVMEPAQLRPIVNGYRDGLRQSIELFPEHEYLYARLLELTADPVGIDWKEIAEFMAVYLYTKVYETFEHIKAES